MTNTSKQLADKIVEAIQEKKGSRISVIDLDSIEGAICRYFIVCQGNSPMQVEAIADSVSDMVREDLGEKPVKVIGLENAVWVAMDYTDVMVHVFVPEMRDYYSIETLWSDAEITEIADLD